jgi:IS5 family transposase
MPIKLAQKIDLRRQNRVVVGWWRNVTSPTPCIVFQGGRLMRVVQNPQMQIGEVDISQIKFDPKSRDDIPRILRGLQYVYTNAALRKEIFQLLADKIAPEVDKGNGRPGMTLWRILVCGVMRLDLNMDFDRLHELVNHHDTIRRMLGHAEDDETSHQFKTLRDNVSLITPELLDQINQIVVNAGHGLIKKKAGEALRGRCDSFVVETDVHYPTDINLLFDAMRKVVMLTAKLCERYGMSDWRQHAYNVAHLKRLMRTAQNRKRGKAKSEEQQAKRQALIAKAHQAYLNVAQHYLDKARGTLMAIEQRGFASPLDIALKMEIEGFMQHAVRQISQTTRRVIDGEIIPHAEKVFSIFEPYTEWVVKGKAGVPVELGLRVCVLEDQYRFILHHQVMEKKTDDQVAVSMVAEAKKRFPDLKVCSFDKGFHSPENQTRLTELLEMAALPRKGKLSQQAQAIQQSDAFINARRNHAAVESAINALEVHGLDRCLDRGIDGFKRYVAMAVLARNIHRIGDILKQQDEKREKRKRKRVDRDAAYRLAA